VPEKGSTHKPETDPELSSNPQAAEHADADTPDKTARDKEQEPAIAEQARTTLSPDAIDSRHIQSDTDQDPLIGKTLHEKYRILELLGAGGMSRVYKAQQTLTRKIVALKLLNKHLSSNPTMMRRFQAEAQASHHLAHPNIITVYDFGITEENQPFIIMD
jgi:serine/threonine protein kinase